MLFNPKKEEYFTRAKIIAPYRSKQNVFAYNESPWFASQDVCFILPQSTEFHIKYLLAILNSSLCFQWLRSKGKRKGETLELYQKPLSDIPIRRIPASDQQPFVSLVDSILAVTKQADYLENAQNQSRVEALTQQIDHLVYKLYGLNSDDIAIVEGKT